MERTCRRVFLGRTWEKLSSVNFLTHKLYFQVNQTAQIWKCSPSMLGYTCFTQNSTKTLVRDKELRWQLTLCSFTILLIEILELRYSVKNRRQKNKVHLILKWHLSNYSRAPLLFCFFIAFWCYKKNIFEKVSWTLYVFMS